MTDNETTTPPERLQLCGYATQQQSRLGWSELLRVNGSLPDGEMSGYTAPIEYVRADLYDKLVERLKNAEAMCPTDRDDLPITVGQTVYVPAPHTEYYRAPYVPATVVRRVEPEYEKVRVCIEGMKPISYSVHVICRCADRNPQPHGETPQETTL